MVLEYLNQDNLVGIYRRNVELRALHSKNLIQFQVPRLIANLDKLPYIDRSLLLASV